MAEVCISADPTEYPSWWATASTVNVLVAYGSSSTVTRTAAKADVTFHPLGVSVIPDPGAAAPVFFPWSHVVSVEKNS